MPASSVPQGASFDEAEHYEFERLLNAGKTSAGNSIFHKAPYNPGGSGSLRIQRLKIGSLLGIIGLVCLLGLTALSVSHGGAGTNKRSIRSSLNLIEVNPPADDRANNQPMFKMSSNMPHTNHVLDIFEKFKEKIKHMIPGRGVNNTNITAMKIAAIKDRMKSSHTLQHINKHDGNFCADDEELLGKLCYKKCSRFNGGKFPVRTSPFSCCQSNPCGLFNQKVNVKICSGYSVAGDSYKDACPHKPGACLENEELYLGTCFKKCSLLTKFVLPFRLAPATCCKKEGKLACMNPLISKTSSDFNVGGGEIYGDLESPSQPHSPIPSLTEIQPENKP